MQSSKIGYQNWLFAMYLIATNLKSISSLKLHRELEITQKSAWHLAHRIRRAWKAGADTPFASPVEADESYFGGRRRNMSKSKREKMTGRGATGKTAVVAGMCCNFQEAAGERWVGSTGLRLMQPPRTAC